MKKYDERVELLREDMTKIFQFGILFDATVVMYDFDKVYYTLQTSLK